MLVSVSPSDPAGNEASTIVLAPGRGSRSGWWASRALNKVESHTWDSWGAMADMFGELADQIALVDEVANTITAGDLAAVRNVYQRPGLTMPGVVFSHRTQQPVEIA